MSMPYPLVRLIDQALNRVLSLHPQRDELLRRLRDRTVAIRIDGLDWEYFLVGGEGRIEVLQQAPGEVHCRVSGLPFTLLRIATADDEASRYGDGLHMEGEVALGRVVQQLFDLSEVDWEEALSHYTGDVVAFRLGEAARQGWRRLRRNLSDVEQDTADLLRDELMVAPAQAEIDVFLAEVDGVRDDVERLAQRVARLNARLEQGT